MTKHDDVQRIAEVLGESDAKPLAELSELVTKLGPDQADQLAVEAADIHGGEGMLTVDGSRARTLGGVFFKLARDRIGRTPPSKPFRRWRWHEAAQFAQEALNSERGEGSTVKITLIGRPGRVVVRDNVVVTTMHNHKRPSLPKQLPKLSGADVETPYTIFIAARQWRKVVDSLQSDKDDQLIIEGYPFLDPDVKGICVFARMTTTKALQRALREAQRNKLPQST
ncbi:MAG: hypothetical protein AAGC55_05435 [Myxococcota bacterium]